jgi:glycerol-3-phosphate dehydrogenase
MDKPHAIIIGAGFTGCAVAHDLALRGFAVSVVDRGDIAYGTSGRTHGLLHSGGRYCVNDRESAIECIDENMILRKITPQCIEPNGGLFVAISESDLAYKADFLRGAEACHIPTRELSVKQALALEPQLNPGLLAAVEVPDGTFDPLRLALAFAGTAKANGARFYLYSNVAAMVFDGQGRVCGVTAQDRKTGKDFDLRGDIVISATGAWAGLVGELANLNVPILPTPGVMVAFLGRLTERVVNRMCIPDDGDIILPQRRMEVVGTTSFEVNDVDYIPVTDEQVQMMIERGAELLPRIRENKMRGAYMSSRPLIKAAVDARSIARTFKCFDHGEQGVEGIVTITGGKATTCRAMAEATANVVCRKLGVSAACTTRETPLLSYRSFYQHGGVE